MSLLEYKDIPDHFQITFNSSLLKAREEDGQRLIFMEAHDESLDLQNERVMMKALQEQREYFLRKGNIDLYHYSKLGPTTDRPNPRVYEIGQPIDVTFDYAKKSTLVKAVIYQGNQMADWFWQTLSYSPPMKWYPSIGGATVHKSIEQNGTTVNALIDKIIWSNIGLTQEPINQGVPPIQTVPFGVFMNDYHAGSERFIYKSVDTATAAPLVREDLEGDGYPQDEQQWTEHYKNNSQNYIKILASPPFNIPLKQAEQTVKYFYAQKILRRQA